MNTRIKTQYIVILIEMFLFFFLCLILRSNYFNLEKIKTEELINAEKYKAINDCFESSQIEVIEGSVKKREPVISVYKLCMNDKGIETTN